MTFPAASSMFARRLALVEESSTMRVMTEAQKLKAEGADIVDLGAGEPDFNTPPHVKEAAKRAIDGNFTRYTPAAGVPELRDAIRTRMRDDFGVERERDEVIATVGGKQSIFNVVLALVNPGDEVAIPSPYWVTFPQVVRLCEGTPVIVETFPEEGFRLTVEALRRHLGPRTRLVILNSPHNPTGSVIPWPELLDICEIAASRGTYVLVDECYLRFVYEPRFPATAAAVPGHLRPWVIVAGSLSKTYAMTGWRLGYTIGPKALVDKVVVIQGHETSNPNSIAQAAAIGALTGPQDCVAEMLREYRRRRDFLVPALDGIPGIRCSLPHGAFYAYPDVRGCLDGKVRNSDEFAARLLAEERVAVTPGSGFGTEGFIRISYAASMPALEEWVRRIGRFAAALVERR